jgi:hypothetical protein
MPVPADTDVMTATAEQIVAAAPAAVAGDTASITADAAKALERKGRRWLLWSFVFCPCHLPLTMAVLAAVFGGSAFGVMLKQNTLWVGIVCAVLYAAGVAVGFRHLRRATKGIDCSTGACEI